MNYYCPQNECKSKNIIKHGFFKRKHDYKRIQRFKCKECGKAFSRSTFSHNYYLKKPFLNQPILIHLGESMGIRKISRTLHVNKSTVLHRLKLLGKFCERRNNELLGNATFSDIQFDELITCEHTKCKPITVGAVVCAESRKILGAKASPIPATGILSEKAVKKYGIRKSKKTYGIRALFRRVAPMLNSEFTITTDMDYTYPGQIHKVFHQEEALSFEHIPHYAREARSHGQGELKRGARDPLFVINHTFAMMRDHISRLVRRSWCISKKLKNLQYHLEIYCYYHNRYLL